MTRTLGHLILAACLFAAVSAGCSSGEGEVGTDTTLVPDSIPDDGMDEDVEDSDVPGNGYTFIPVLKKTVALTTEGAAGPDDLVASNAEEGESWVIDVYEVPGMLCVRQDTDDLSTLPAGAVMPGEPAIFAIAHPAPGAAVDERLLYIPHGYGNEALETALAKAYVDYTMAYDAMAEISPSMINLFAQQLTAAGGFAHIVDFLTEELSVEFLRRGWTLVAPGNCWGDQGIGIGQEIVSAYTARRWTRVFDRESIEFARSLHPDPDAVYAYGASGGGARLGQLVMDEPGLFRALVFDSPNDFPGAILSEPLPQLFAMIEMMAKGLTKPILEKFVEAFYGSVEASKIYSLGYRLGVDVHLDDVPIMMGYVTNDPLLHLDAYMPLADALGDPSRYVNEHSQIKMFDSDEHCPFKDYLDQHDPLIDWLEQF